MKALILGAMLTVSCQVLAENEPALDAIQEYLEFAEYSDGAIMPEQLASIDSKDILYVDARNAERYNAGHIPGAINIEWRQILERRDEIPKDKSVVLYCDTGLSSSRAYFILRLAGRENIKVLRGGYLMWKEHRQQSMKAGD
ncbi:MAG TPA: rhodanese-like domain-containing protein [Thiolapillus brandeum]|uniref:Rhodanese-like domain-containing protein n=1 Tax=Thiolapillus brandeum TaxID=1076588 RepID=A0A831RYB9_9GAMM|nr:rhodanese-like domain-containing protein [Thiolapillus brandeum]